MHGRIGFNTAFLSCGCRSSGRCKPRTPIGHHKFSGAAGSIPTGSIPTDSIRGCDSSAHPGHTDRTLRAAAASPLARGRGSPSFPQKYCGYFPQQRPAVIISLRDPACAFIKCHLKKKPPQRGRTKRPCIAAEQSRTFTHHQLRNRRENAEERGGDLTGAERLSAINENLGSARRTPGTRTQRGARGESEGRSAVAPLHPPREPPQSAAGPAPAERGLRTPELLGLSCSSAGRDPALRSPTFLGGRRSGSLLIPAPGGGRAAGRERSRAEGRPPPSTTVTRKKKRSE